MILTPQDIQDFEHNEATTPTLCRARRGPIGGCCQDCKEFGPCRLPAYLEWKGQGKAQPAHQLSINRFIGDAQC